MALKQVTMDFDTYVEELKAAKHLGFNKNPQFKQELTALLKALRDGDRQAYDKAEREIYQILRSLDEITE